MIARTTTTGTMKTYRYNLQRSGYYMNKAMNTVQTGRLFNSFADDPTAAALSFQKRTALLRNSGHIDLNTSIQYKFQQAWKALDQVEGQIDTVSENSTFKALMLGGANDADASARNALGQSMKAVAENLVQAMNGRYGENFIFSGADGLNVPFSWGPKANPDYDPAYVPDPDNPVPEDINQFQFLKDDGTGTNSEKEASRVLSYRGVPVDTTDAAELEKLRYFSEDEVKNADIGLGFDINSGRVETTSVFNQALQGVDFLGGYGVDQDGDPKNIISIIDRMGTILKNCDAEDGEFAPGEKEEYYRLAKKFEGASATVKDQYVELDTRSSFLKANASILESTKYNLTEQISGLEDADEALAISDFIFAKYTYDTALKVGNSVLSQSLMDYMNL